MAADAWLRKAETMMQRFANQYGSVYRRTKRQVYASFEIGCFLSLVEFYKDAGFSVSPEKLEQTAQGPEFKYLTTPAGNPANFSYVRIERDARAFHIRQQVRVESHLHVEIRFTPDLVVIPEQTVFMESRDPDYSSGNKRFFRVSASDVAAAHECKSMPPFPELFVSFLGMLVAAHGWLGSANDMRMVCADGPHLAPTLFVGGTARNLHRRMIGALGRVYPMNAVLGLHSGSWRLSRHSSLCRIRSPGSRPARAKTS